VTVHRLPRFPGEYSFSVYPDRTSSCITGTWSSDPATTLLYNGDSLSLTISGFNPHTHLSIGGNAHYYNSSNIDLGSVHLGNVSFVVSMGGTTADDEELHLTSGDGYAYSDFDFGFGTDATGYLPLKHRDSSATITFTPTGLPTGDSVSMDWLDVSAMRPTVDISTVKGSAVEVDDPTLTFRVSREPGVPMDDSLDVSLSSPTGTATEGVDYGTLPRTITIPAGADHVDFSTAAIDDIKAEGAETIGLPLLKHASLLPYNFDPSGQAWASIDDNVRVSSIKVWHPLGGTSETTNLKFSFWVYIQVRGEHLDRVVIAQDIRADSKQQKFDSHAATPQEIRQAYINDGNDPDLVQTEGTGLIPDWGWSGLNNWEHPGAPVTAKTSVGYKQDNHSGYIGGRELDPTRPFLGLPQYITWVGSITRKMHVRTGFLDQYGTYEILKTKDWSFTWDNHPSLWTDENPPEKTCTDWRKPGGTLKGDFDGLESIEG
jgi:hypothetical protein